MAERTAGDGGASGGADQERGGEGTHLGWDIYGARPGADNGNDTDGGAAGNGPGNDEPALQAVEHLQMAALEMVKAARACLDVVEALVNDPGPLLDAAAAAGRAAAATARVPGFPGPPGAAGPSGRRTKVEHIPVEAD